MLIIVSIYCLYVYKYTDDSHLKKREKIYFEKTSYKITEMNR